MSRSFDFAVEVKPVINEEKLDEIMGAISDELGAYSINMYHYDNAGNIDGSCTLCGGECEGSAHDRVIKHLQEEFPELITITTKWLCTEYGDWDEVFDWSKQDEQSV